MISISGNLRSLAAELGFWPATTDPDDIERHREHNERFDRMNAHDPYHSPCPVCGQPTRYKQWPRRCACLESPDERREPSPLAVPPLWNRHLLVRGYFAYEPLPGQAAGR
jgi:hypothetical protein